MKLSEIEDSGRWIIVAGTPLGSSGLVVADTVKLRVLQATQGEVVREKNGWTVRMTDFQPLPDADIDVTETDKNKFRYHIKWPDHDIHFEVLRGHSADETKTLPIKVPTALRKQSSSRPVRKSIGLGLEWEVPNVLENIPKPTVTAMPVPSNLPLKFKNLGDAYRIELDRLSTRVPVLVTIPVPKAAFESGESIAVVLNDLMGFSLLVPVKTDPVRSTVTVATCRFSTFVPVLWNTNYPAAGIEGEIRVERLCEEKLEGCYFETVLTGNPMVTDFPVFCHGSGKYSLQVPIPEDLFGKYVFRRIVGYSKNFLFAASSTVEAMNIVDMGPNFRDIGLVPVSGRLQGVLVDVHGNPIPNAEFTLFLGDSREVSTLTDSAGRFLLNTIPLKPVSADPSREYLMQYVVRTQIIGGHGTYRYKGAVLLRPGQTMRPTLILSRPEVEEEVSLKEVFNFDYPPEGKNAEGAESGFGSDWDRI